MTEQQQDFELANEAAQAYFRELTATCARAIDQQFMTHETAIATLLAVASVIGGELPNGAEVMRRKFDDITSQMAAAGRRRFDA